MTVAFPVVRSSPTQNFRHLRPVGQAKDHVSIDSEHQVQRELGPTNAIERSAASRVRAETVAISPSNLVKRHSTECDGIIAESVYAPARSTIEMRYAASVHLLVLYEEGARREGQTSIDGLPPSSLRNFANKLAFVPAGHAYREWHETNEPIRITYLYLDPVKLRNFSVPSAYTPKSFFEDSSSWQTAIKLKRLVERNQPQSEPYATALANVLAHELSSDDKCALQSSSTTRGGLAGWQMRAVAAYIEERVDKQISLASLAGLAHLSQYHFCRAFKQSFGSPPHLYHLQRKTERAKVLLSERSTSITEIGVILGYSQTSSFSLAFRKITGQTPSDFRRNFARMTRL